MSSKDGRKGGIRTRKKISSPERGRGEGQPSEQVKELLSSLNRKRKDNQDERNS